GVERFDQPIAPMPDVLLAVAQFFAQPIPIAVTPDIHPMTRPTFAVPRVVEETLHDFRVTIVRGEIRLGGGALLGSGRQADQIEVESSQESFGWSFRSW